MMMGIYFDEEKCKEYNYDINERYQIIDKFFEDNHVKKIDNCMQSYYNSMRKCGLLNEDTM